MSPRITLDELATIVMNRFNELEDCFRLEFKRLDGRFEGIGQRFEIINKHLEIIDSRLDGIENRLDHHADYYVPWKDHEKALKRLDILEQP